MNRQAVAVVSVSFLLLLGAFAVPQMIDSTKDPQMYQTVLDIGATDEVTDGLTIHLEDSTNTEATVNITDVETGNETDLVIPEGGTANYTLPGGDGQITAVSTNNQEAELTVAYDPLYGYSDAGRILIDNIGLILILFMFLGVMAAMKAVIS